MKIKELIEQKHLSKYRLSKESGIPYSTLTDIINEKVQLEKCTAETIYKLSQALGITMEALLAPCFVKRCSFELFKSNVCHHVKTVGGIEFIIETLEKDEIRDYYARQWYPESFYLLAMLDYISRINNIPLCKEYEDLRKQRLSEPLYPTSIIAASIVEKNDLIKTEAQKTAIPEFMRFNIIESEVANVL